MRYQRLERRRVAWRAGQPSGTVEQLGMVVAEQVVNLHRTLRARVAAEAGSREYGASNGNDAAKFGARRRRQWRAGGSQRNGRDSASGTGRGRGKSEVTG